MACRVILSAVFTALILSFLAVSPAKAEPAQYSLRVSAQGDFKQDLEACISKAYASHPELQESEEGFRYFISLIGMPIIQDESGEILGYSVSSLVISPLDTEKIVCFMATEAKPSVAPLLNRAHNLLDYKLFIMRKQNLFETCKRIAETTAAAIATEEARRTSLEVRPNADN